MTFHAYEIGDEVLYKQTNCKILNKILIEGLSKPSCFSGVMLPGYVLNNGLTVFQNEVSPLPSSKAT